MIDYARAKREMPGLKSKLTRAKKTKDPDKVLKAVEEAYAAFDAWGAYPDNWHLWESAKTDANFAKARGLKLRLSHGQGRLAGGSPGSQPA